MSDDDAAAERAAERARIQRMHFAACVEEMFDDYAPTFEKSLVTELNYKLYNELPGTLDDVQKQQQQQQPGDDDDGTPPPLSATLAVDLGCGTGLAGQALKSRCVGRLVGCDLSRRMLLVAKKKVGVYDELVACDCVAYLHRNVKPATADLIVAADVLVYMRDLADLFDAVVAALRPGGLFAFSTEMASSEEVGGEGGAGWVERPTERIAHSEEYLRRLAASRDLQVSHLSETIVRRDSGRGLPGHLVVMAKDRAKDHANVECE
jgi:predicted TPR repeat methyltransferase